MPVNKNGLTKEMIAKAMQCKTAEDLMALAKSEGAEITKAEAEAYLAELADIELDEKALKSVAGGSNACWNCRLPLQGLSESSCGCKYAAKRLKICCVAG